MFTSPSSLGARGGKKCRYSVKAAVNVFSPSAGERLGRDGLGMKMFPFPSSLGARGGKRRRYSPRAAANAFSPFGRGEAWARRPRDEDVSFPLSPLGGEGREDAPVQRKDCGQCLFSLLQGRGLGETAQGVLTLPVQTARCE